MITLVLNCGSSSIKYQLLNTNHTDDPEVMASGVVERIGLEEGILTHKALINGEKRKHKLSGLIPDHTAGISLITDALVNHPDRVIESVMEIQAVGHRVAHGGEYFKNSVLIDDKVKEQIAELSDLAPLHNPAHIAGIEAMEHLLPHIPQVAVFDTSFHQSMPPESFLYAIPYEYYTRHKLRRYGFHGTSHKYVAEKACEHLNLDMNRINIVTCHLGNGASIAAIKNGQSFDTSMGFTPVEGLIMGTRVGNLDVGALLFLMEKEGLNLQEANDIINRKSGVLGISGVSSDMRDIEEESWNKGNTRATLALNMYHMRVKRYIGAFAAEMGGIDVLIFTGGIGENGPESREEICRGLDYMGVSFNKEANIGVRSELKVLNTPDSKVKVLVVPTNEEKVIAVETAKVVQQEAVLV